MARQNRRKKAEKNKSTLASVLSIVGTVVLILVIVLCVPLTIPRLFGYQVYTVISGSMEPVIPTGSLIYTKAIAPEDVKEKDIIAFYSGTGDGSIITHRVVTNQTVSGEFVTKGDANAGNDPTPVDYDYLIGIVKLTIPFLGRISAVIATTMGKIATACLIGVALILHLIASKLHGDIEGE